jgi:hypothetical protein
VDTRQNVDVVRKNLLVSRLKAKDQHENFNLLPELYKKYVKHKQLKERIKIAQANVEEARCQEKKYLEILKKNGKNNCQIKNDPDVNTLIFR